MAEHVFGLPSLALVDYLKSETDALAAWLVATRRSFHRHPELGWQEIETTKRIVGELSAMGFDVTAGKDMLRDAERLGLSATPLPDEGNTGCIAVYDSGRPGPTTCLRVDIDALPIREATTDHRPAAEGWASASEGTMHACAHDGHIAIGLGVARVLRPLLDRANGKLLLLFQPAEEGGRGARAVVDAGWMDDVDLFMAIHIGLGIPSGTIAVGVEGFLATRKLRATLSGRAAHAGKSPQSGRSALLAACHATIGLHGLAQSSEPGIRVNVGVLSAGKSINVVTDEAMFEFEIRAERSEALYDLDERCRRMIELTAAAHEVSSKIELRGEATSWRNPDDLVGWVKIANNTADIFPTAIVDHKFGASEDATLLAHAAAAHGGLAGIFVLGADLADDHHTPNFDFDEDILAQGVLILAALIGGALSIDF